MKGCKVDLKLFWLIVFSNVYDANVMMLYNVLWPAFWYDDHLVYNDAMNNAGYTILNEEQYGV